MANKEQVSQRGPGEQGRRVCKGEGLQCNERGTKKKNKNKDNEEKQIMEGVN